MPKPSYWIKTFASSFYWFLHQRRWGVKGVFEDVYERQLNSETFRNIFRDVFGDEYAEEANPTGFLTVTDLRNLVECLALQPEQSLVDLACGLGGAGLWVARETKTRLTGVDISEIAVDKARQRIDDFDLAGRAEFLAGDFAATRLPAATFDGAMSVDSLYLVPDQKGAVHETARILRSGSRFVFTNWEVDGPSMIADYRPLLESAGFSVERREETPEWRTRQKSIYERILAQKQTLIEEMGEPGARFWIRGAEKELPRLPQMRRVLISARKK